MWNGRKREGKEGERMGHWVMEGDDRRGRGYLVRRIHRKREQTG